jgi:HAD superfamily hydrolase (TIGR01490 family)
VGRTAAIFDLDRTLLRGASGPLINQALTELGLRATRIPGEGLLYKSFEVFGENPVGMALARAAALAVRGWSVDRLRAAGRRAAELLVNNVASYVPGVVEEHRRAGHVLVLATTTPDDLVRPLAELLGLDDVVATRYAWVDGVYTGKLDGGFVWGFGKLTALRKWADQHDVDLSESFAYSDSINDVPMLSAVGHPTAVNPDLALHAIATVRRWPILHLDAPPGVPTLAGVEAFDVGKRVIRPELFPYARFDIAGVENIPDSGPFVLVSNHRRASRQCFGLARPGGASAPSGRGPRRPPARNHSAGQGVLRSRVARQDWCGAIGGRHRRQGHSRRTLEHRIGLATVLVVPERGQRVVSTDRACACRTRGRWPRSRDRRCSRGHRATDGGHRRSLAGCGS